MAYNNKIMDPMGCLQNFLSFPIDDGTAILDLFAELPNAVVGMGKKSMERFVYVPGNRKDKVLLVAHVDTVWDRNYPGHQEGEPPIFLPDRVISSSREVGIGADDRAGCALLWHLKDLGHSLLLLDGEEKGHFGAIYLARKHKKLLREFNRHRYFLALDYPGNGLCHYHGIHNSKAFCAYIQRSFQCKPISERRGSDLPYLCRGACGANLSIGYYANHTSKELLALGAWEQIHAKLRAVLMQPQPVFRTRKLPRLRDFTVKKLKVIWSKIRKLKKKKEA